MAALTVGTGMQFRTIKDAVAASADGDTVYVMAGTYLNDFSTINTKINLIGVGGMVHLTADRVVGNGKGFFIVNNDVTIDHFEFSDATSYDYNGAGIRYQAGDLTIKNSYFHDNEDGLLATPLVHGTGNVTIVNSEFAHNGAGDGQSHNIYVGYVENFTMTDSYTHDAVVGHEIKSRAQNTIILRNRIFDGNSNASYSIDLPNGGNAVVKNNVIEQGPNSQNRIIVAFSADIMKRPLHIDSQLLLENNTIINDLTARSTGVKNFSDAPVTMLNNKVFGFDTNTRSVVAVGAVTQTGTTVLATEPTLRTGHPFTSSPYGNIVWGPTVANILQGTTKIDVLAGGSGSDTFIIRAGSKNDIIAGFDTPGGDDVIRLEGYGITSFDGVLSIMSQHESNVVLQLAPKETLTILNAQIGDFTAEDFLFSDLTPRSPSSPWGVLLARPDPFKLPGVVRSPLNQITGDAANNTLIGTPNDDSLNGKAGIDKMVGGLGNDLYVVDDPRYIVRETPNQGIDTVQSRAAAYTLPGNIENMALAGSIAHVATGNNLNNIILASDFNDTINGSGGNDIIKTGSGAYLLTGGTGNDIFQFLEMPDQPSRITDFHVGQDLVDLRTLMDLGHYSGLDPLADGAMTVTPDGQGNVLVSIDPTHSGILQPIVILQGITPYMLIVGADILF